MKGHVNKKLKLTKDALSDKPRSSILNDPRPIKDEAFIREAKSKFFKFLENSNFQIAMDNSKFTKLTQSDVKAIIEHCITVLNSHFRLNNTEKSPEDRILNFFSGIGYKSNLTKTHITSPTILSSVPYVVASFDFLRRIATCHINAHAPSFFPRVPDLGISAECILDALIVAYIHTERGEFTMETMYEFRDTIRKKVGIKTNDEIAAMSVKIRDIEELFHRTEVKQHELSALKAEEKHLLCAIESELGKHDKELRLRDELTVEINSENANLDKLLQMKKYLETQKDKFDEMGYGEQMKQISDCKEKMLKFRNLIRDTKLEVDELKEGLRTINSEIDDVKLHLQKEFTEICTIFPHLIPDEMLQIVNNFKLEHLLTYDTSLRPYILSLKTAIINVTKTEEKLLEQRKQECRSLKATYLTLERDVKNLEMDEHKLSEATNYNERCLVELKNSMSEDEKAIQELMSKIEEDEVQCDEWEMEAAFLKKAHEEIKIETENAMLFYECDIELRKDNAEQRLLFLQENRERHQRMTKENEEFFKKVKEDLKEESTELVGYGNDMVEFYTELMKSSDVNIV